MPPVTIQEGALTDPRIALCAKSLRMSQSGFFVRLISLWSHVTLVGNPVVHAEFIGAILHRAPKQILEALPRARLAKQAETDHLDLTPLRYLYGDYTWYLKQKEPLGGPLRTTRRDQSATVADADHTQLDSSDVLRALRDLDGRAHIDDIAVRLDHQRLTVQRQILQLIDAGDVIECDTDVFELARDMPL